MQPYHQHWPRFPGGSSVPQLVRLQPALCGARPLQDHLLSVEQGRGLLGKPFPASAPLQVLRDEEQVWFFFSGHIRRQSWSMN